MSGRKPIPNSIRFDVFKRDGFSCQYCGAKSPDVVLNVDHINPVANGGDNSLINLVTSCFSCNSGKSDKLLSENTEVEKQRKQLDELNERRNQLEMLASWRSGLLSIDDDTVSEVCALIADVGDYEPSDVGRKLIGKWLNKFTVEELMKACRASFKTYARIDENGMTTDASWDKAFDKIPNVAASMRRGVSPEVIKGYYVAAILENRTGQPRAWGKREFSEKIAIYINEGADGDVIADIAKKSDSIDEFMDYLFDLMVAVKERQMAARKDAA